METRQHHKIDKIKVKIQTDSEDDGNYLKDHASEWINSKVLKCMESYIAEVEEEIGKHIIQFDKLKISLEMQDGKLRDDNVCEQIRNQLDAQIKDFIRNLKSSHAGSENPASSFYNSTETESAILINPEQRELETVFYFLETGRCPWWMSAPELNEVLTEKKISRIIAREKDKFYKRLIESLRISSFSHRLIRQFPAKLVQTILTNSFYSLRGSTMPPARKMEALQALAGKLSQNQKEEFWSAVIQLLLVVKTSQAVSVDLWKAITNPISKWVKNSGLSGHLETYENMEELPVWLESLTNLQLPEEIKREITIIFDSISTKDINDNPGADKEQTEDEVSVKQDELKQAELKANELESEIEKQDQLSRDAAETGKSNPKETQNETNDGINIKDEVIDKKNVGTEENVSRPSDQQNIDGEKTENENALPRENENIEVRKETINPESEAIQIVPEISSELKSEASPETRLAERSLSRSEEKELQKGVIVENAGLILLHPFLKSFFLQTELMDANNEFTDAELAVHVLHYIATGIQQDWDHNLLFEKFLCNVPLEESLARERNISPEIIKEVDSLLEAVLQNWTALSKTSVNLLRGEFLQRPGKLFKDEMSVRLTVERKTQDILLDKIPWNVSMSKLPWQGSLIYTTW